MLTIFGYGQGLVRVSLSSAVLLHRETGKRGLGIRNQWHDGADANAAGVAVIGAIVFAIEAAYPARLALFAASGLFARSIIACAAFLSWMRRAST